MKSLKYISAVADYFEVKLAQQLVPDMTPQQIQDRLIAANLELSIPKVKAKVMQFLALKNDNDCQLSGIYMPKEKKIYMAVNFPANLRQHIVNKLTENARAYPNAPPTTDASAATRTLISTEISRSNNLIPTVTDSVTFV